MTIRGKCFTIVRRSFSQAIIDEQPIGDTVVNGCAEISGDPLWVVIGKHWRINLDLLVWKCTNRQMARQQMA